MKESSFIHLNPIYVSSGELLGSKSKNYPLRSRLDFHTFAFYTKTEILELCSAMIGAPAFV